MKEETQARTIAGERVVTTTIIFFAR